MTNIIDIDDHRRGIRPIIHDITPPEPRQEVPNAILARAYDRDTKELGAIVLTFEPDIQNAIQAARDAGKAMWPTMTAMTMTGVCLDAQALDERGTVQ